MDTPTNSTQLSPDFIAANHDRSLQGVTSSMLILATILVVLRVYVRRRVTNVTRGHDDYMIMVSWVLFVGLCAITFATIPYGGAGRHLAVVGFEKYATDQKLLYALDWCYIISILLSRLAVISLYLRIFVERNLRICCNVVGVLLILDAIATFVATQTQCMPLKKLWEPEIPGTCFGIVSWYKNTNIPNVILDTFILLLPIRTIVRLNMSKTRRIGIALVFLTGSVGLIAAIIRTAEFFTVDWSDPTYVNGPLLVWSVFECALYIIAACLIGLRPLVLIIARRWTIHKTSRDERRYRKQRSDITWNGQPKTLPLRSVIAYGGHRISFSKDSMTHIVPDDKSQDSDDFSALPIMVPDQIHVRTTFDVDVEANEENDLKAHPAAVSKFHRKPVKF